MTQQITRKDFIPISQQDLTARGYSEIDVLLITGDAYIDSPAFGIPLLARWLEKHGIKVGIVAQPNCSTTTDFLKMGRPKYFIGISSGTVDSMLNNYTANKKPRSDDMYSPGGVGGKRPDYASVVYTNLARKAWPETPIVVGGVEVSLRRLAHYDYWQNKVRPSILCDLEADFLAFGMGEQSVLDLVAVLKGHFGEKGEMASRLSPKFAAARSELHKKRGIAYLTTKDEARQLDNKLTLPSFEEVKSDKKKFAKTAMLIEQEANPFSGKKLVQYHGSKAVVVNEQPLPLSTTELDELFSLPFTKEQHPDYSQTIPAYEMIKYSINSTRGCYGGCSFCAIALHQGKVVQSRSPVSLITEIQALTQKKGFTGHISDVGGPTANSYGTHCKSKEIQSVCKKYSCLFPKVCPHLQCSHKKQVDLLSTLRKLPKIKSIRIGSGIRFDLCFADKDYGHKYLRDIITHHVGGQLKVAPEHLDTDVLNLMRKPDAALFERFLHLFKEVSEAANKEQYVIPYFISGFPGCTPQKMKVVHDYLQRKHWNVQQVQAFIPTPMTIATAMFYTGIDPFTKQPVFVAKSHGERKLQQALLQPNKPSHKKFFHGKTKGTRREQR